MKHLASPVCPLCGGSMVGQYCPNCHFVRRLFVLVALFLLPALAAAQDKEPLSIRFPKQLTIPTAPIGKLTANTFYVIDSDLPIIVTSSPLGLVTIVEEAGPIKVRGVFADGDGKVETRTYKGKSVFFVEAAALGKCELLVIPAGAKSAADILRKPLEVFGDKPPPPVDPPAKRIAEHVTFIGCDTGDSVKVKNDLALRAWIKDNGMTFDALPAGHPDIKGRNLQPSIDKAGGLPCVLFMDDLGVVVGDRVTTVAALKTLGTPYLKGK